MGEATLLQKGPSPQSHLKSEILVLTGLPVAVAEIGRIQERGGVSGVLTRQHQKNGLPHKAVLVYAVGQGSGGGPDEALVPGQPTR